jgi:hypothetical protein
MTNENQKDLNIDRETFEVRKVRIIVYNMRPGCQGSITGLRYQDHIAGLGFHDRITVLGF